MKVYIWGTRNVTQRCIYDVYEDVEIIGYVEINLTKDEFGNILLLK